ncbi:DUF1254 domain-containing protein [Paracoccus sp. PAR01]|uniref:DUF1254 domain-containing protein n=1 Tax=Paracoccus sp. PAR01 TaxID=2769282 RepID=UPI00177D66AB|nr:DUF1254 domain-containing protein [Paracoccus sp. PAR01]MBD9529575.1 DUF1254 domain-containing protein [Paracoccus sp. PAR01]
MFTLFSRTLALGLLAAAPALAEPITVNATNFIRAESDLYFSAVVAARGGVGMLGHERAMTPVDKQAIIRMNRDTLYSSALFDLDAGPVTITVPQTDGRFMSMQVFDQDHYTHGVHYDAGTYTLKREDIGTRYVMLGIRTLVNPDDAADLEAVHKLQDQITAEQPGGPGNYEVPDWDAASRDATRATILALAADLPDTRHMFGARSEVDPVLHFIGSAMGWGGNPDRDALYLNRTAANNDGQQVYRLTVGDVPVQGFWSITVYNAQGFIAENDLKKYTLNNLTAAKAQDGSVTVQFGGCDGEIPNCLPVPENWNWMVRLYRPQAAILDGSWTFPELEAVQ